MKDILQQKTMAQPQLNEDERKNGIKPQKTLLSLRLRSGMLMHQVKQGFQQLLHLTMARPQPREDERKRRKRVLRKAVNRMRGEHFGNVRKDKKLDKKLLWPMQ